MKKESRDIIDKLIVKCKDVPILDIVSKHIDLKKSGHNYKGFCPWHTDNHPSLSVNTTKNVWKCFVCEDKSGGPIRFIQNYYNLDYLEAVLKISKEHNFESISVLDDIEKELEEDNKKKYKNKKKKVDNYKRNNIKAMKKNNKSLPKAEIEILDKVYSIFADCCPLTISDYKMLREERALSDEVIRKSYFTFPTKSVLKKFFDRLKKAGYEESILDYIPGFYKDKDGKYTFDGYKGIGRKIRNADGRIQAIQIRTYQKIHNQRYFWFSSTESVSSGSPADVVYPKEIKNPVICVTEGSFKAEKLAENNLLTISIQGVGSWESIIEEIILISKKPEYKEAVKRYMKFLKDSNIKDKRIPFYICFDADMISNFRVFGHAKNMSDYLLRRFKNINPLYISWDESLGKGIDDLIINSPQNMKKIKKFEKNSFDIVHDKIEKKLLKEHIEFEGKIEKVPKEIMVEYFNNCFGSKEYVLK